MKPLRKPLPHPVYDTLRDVQFLLDEVTLDQDLDVARSRLAQCRQRLQELILAADAAIERERMTEDIPLE